MSERDEGSTKRLSPWLLGVIAVLLVAATLRLAALELKPFHHDEGVNGFFVTRLARQGTYSYDPTNYHGPTLYYFSIPAVWVFGLNEPALRALPALAGLLSVALLLALRRELGESTALAAAAFLALSPGAVYFSRYYIHEMLVVLFTLAVAVAGIKLRDSFQLPRLLGLSLAAALLFATKETTPLHLGVLAIATVLACWLAGGRLRLRQRLGLLDATARTGLGWAALLFVLVSGLLYSSFLTNVEGVVDAFRSLAVWSRTGTSAHVNPIYQHALWLWEAEPATVALGTAGGLLALWRCRREPLAVFVLLWGLGLLAAYSLVPYKTPWLGLNVVVPLAILAGYLVGVVGKRLPWLAAIIVLAGGALSGAQATRLCFVDYDDEKHPYVYAHTQRGFLRLVEQVEELGETSAAGNLLSVSVTSPEHWPVAWYLRDYPGVGYPGKVSDELRAPVVIGSTGQRAELVSRLGTAYLLLGEYPLRPGVKLLLFARRELTRR